MALPLESAPALKAEPTRKRRKPRERRSPLLGMWSAGIVIGRLGLLFTAVLLLQRMQRDGSWEAKLLLPIVFLVLLSTFARRLSDVKVWALYIVGFMAFVQLRTYADETGMPHFASYPITLDQLMFLGQVPTAWLQKHLYDPANVRPYEIVFAVTYVSYFFVPHIMAIASWRLRPLLFPRVPLAILVTFHVGLLFYFLLPTVPPWLAHEFGRGPEMARVMLTLTSQVDPNGYENAARAVGANDVGAMPSLHMALTVLTALVAAEFGRFWKYVGWLYAFMMGLSLVYLGEHYVIDEVAGVALALGAWKFSAWALRHWQFEQIPVAHPQPLAVGAPLGAEPPAPERVA